MHFKRKQYLKKKKKQKQSRYKYLEIEITMMCGFKNKNNHFNNEIP